jgi:hypothetical protein
MLKIKNKIIFDELGRELKKIECPYDVTLNELKQVDAQKLFCNRCSKNIIDTDFMSESQIIQVLKHDKECCLKINPVNPIFEVES